MVKELNEKIIKFFEDNTYEKKYAQLLSRYIDDINIDKVQRVYTVDNLESFISQKLQEGYKTEKITSVRDFENEVLFKNYLVDIGYFDHKLYRIVFSLFHGHPFVYDNELYILHKNILEENQSTIINNKGNITKIARKISLKKGEVKLTDDSYYVFEVDLGLPVDVLLGEFKYELISRDSMLKEVEYNQDDDVITYIEEKGEKGTFINLLSLDEVPIVSITYHLNQFFNKPFILKAKMISDVVKNKKCYFIQCNMDDSFKYKDSLYHLGYLAISKSLYLYIFLNNKTDNSVKVLKTKIEL